MNGFIVINKEKNYTSFDCCRIAKKVLGTKRIGHLGTLDPLAKGVLVLAVNEATKLVPYLESDSKTYLAEVTLGIYTNTYDLEGVVEKQQEVYNVNVNNVDNVLNSFLGKQLQTPPIYSAIKKDGKKLYEYARSGKNVEIEKRSIEIYSIRRTTDVVGNDKTCKFSFEVMVSKGTYIRSLCVDIAEKLGYPGVMSSLLRIKSGIFSLDEAISMDDLKNGNYNLITMLDALKNYPICKNEEIIKKTFNGMTINSKLVKEELNELPKMIVIGNKDLKAIYEYDQNLNLYKACRIWN